jgi:hypothetical protein
MTVRRTTATATLLAALAAGSVLLTSAGMAFAQNPADRAHMTVPGMATMHRQMTTDNPGMARMHQLMNAGNPGMARMHQLMTDGPP